MSISAVFIFLAKNEARSDYHLSANSLMCINFSPKHDHFYCSNLISNSPLSFSFKTGRVFTNELNVSTEHTLFAATVSVMNREVRNLSGLGS